MLAIGSATRFIAMAIHEVPARTESPLRLRVAAEVRAWRARRNMTQVQLARALGISQPQVSARLRGETPITLDEIDALARVFGTTADVILSGVQANEDGPQRLRAEASSSLPRLDSNQQPAGCSLSLVRGGAPVARRTPNGRIARSAPRSTRGLTPQPNGPFRTILMAAVG